MNMQLSNPFSWCIMDFQSSYNLVKYFDMINFAKFKLLLNHDNSFSVIIDDKIKVDYVHYLLSDKYKTPTKTGDNDISYDKMYEYVVEKYLSRCQRMVKCKITPTFIFATANHGLKRHVPFTIDEQSMLDDLDKPYQIIISYDKMITPKKLICIEQNRQFFGNGILFSDYIYNEMRLRKVI